MLIPYFCAEEFRQNTKDKIRANGFIYQCECNSFEPEIKFFKFTGNQNGNSGYKMFMILI